MSTQQNWISVTVNLKEVAKEVPASVYVMANSKEDILEALFKLYGKQRILDDIEENYKELT